MLDTKERDALESEILRLHEERSRLLDELEQLKEDLAFTITAYKGADLERSRLLEVLKAVRKRHWSTGDRESWIELEHAMEACQGIEASDA